MKVSDYVIDFLVKHGVPDIFLVSGGGIMHLVDSVGRHPGMHYICNHHEQACAIAAEAYARTKNGVGACLVTTGPGSTNALSGIAGAFVDSIPVIVISGQVRRALMADYKKLRQFGPQEINIDDMARPVVKYFKTVMDAASIRWEMECAWHHAITGRPGPVWINIPLDVQDANVDPANLVGFEPPPTCDPTAGKGLKSMIEKTIVMLRAARRPVVIGGNGIHLGQAHEAFERFLHKTRIPAVFTVGSVDLIDERNPSNIGRFGPLGQRRANIALQNADLVLSVGASMSVSSIGFNTTGFAPRAKRIMVNIDKHELEKSNYKPDIAIATDPRTFFEEFERQAQNFHFSPSAKWLVACENWRKQYPTVTPDYLADTEHVNSYYFARILSELLPQSAVVVTGNSLDFWSVYQTFEVKLGQRIFTNSNYGSMGWDLPAVIGAATARPKDMVCLPTGDGSLQFNVQELLTIRANKLPVKIFVLNNHGYESIRATQKNFFNSRFVGSSFNSGLANPDFRLLANAYGLSYEFVANNQELEAKLVKVLTLEGPVLCELNLSPDQPRSPKSMSIRKPDGTFETRPLEDQFPFLPREEVWRNMHLFDDET